MSRARRTAALALLALLAGCGVKAPPQPPGEARHAPRAQAPAAPDLDPAPPGEAPPPAPEPSPACPGCTP